LANIAKSMGIQRVPFWPPNSPNLCPIENSFDYLKDSVDNYFPINSSKIEKEKAGQFLCQEWINNIDGIVNHLCLSFKDKLELCKKHRGNNNFRV
jgi:hypothetical protein